MNILKNKYPFICLIMIITNFNLGAQNNVDIQYFENGNPKEIGFKNDKGIIYGKRTYYRKEGSIDLEVTFNEKGEVEGPFAMYFKNGQLEAKGSYSSKGFYEVDGDYEDYYKNGQLNSKGVYKRGEQIGKWISYFIDGKIASISEFNKDGIIQKDKSYYKNGQLRRNVTYNEKGDEKGDLLVYYPNGQLFTQTHFDDKGNKKNTYTSYYKNGQILEIGDYAGVDYFQKKGIWKTYYENARLKTAIEYDNKGKIKGAIKRYENTKENLMLPIIEGNWKLNSVESGFFPKENLQFEKIENKKEDYFEFKRNATLVFNMGNYEIDCAVGLFNLKEGYWKLQNNVLTLELKGEVFAEYLFWWIVEYKVKTEGNKMHLTVHKVVKNKKLPTDSTWEELIKK